MPSKKQNQKKAKRTPASVPFACVRRVLTRRLPNLDTEVVQAMLAAVIANQLDGPPVWSVIIVPPSMGKTVMIEPLERIFDAELLTKLTPNTLKRRARECVR